jgi:hypothetical protein
MQSKRAAQLPQNEKIRGYPVPDLIREETYSAHLWITEEKCIEPGKAQENAEEAGICLAGVGCNRKAGADGQT